LLVGGGSAFAAVMFTDIEGNTHEDSIIEMANRGITQGYPDGTFRPDEPVSRAQMMTFLDRYTSGMGCTDCHDDSSTITGVEFAWSETRKGEGEAAVYAGGRSGCSGCHSGGGFHDRMMAGETNPDDFTMTYANPSRVDCRACHEIHETYTGADWALETTAAVPLYAFNGETFDAGEGNLCANCHQPRRDFPEAQDGMITGISEHWGPHHGPQAAMLMGLAGIVEGSPGSHYNLIGDSCVSCHMGEGSSHSFAPSTDACTSCHGEVDDFDVNGFQTQVEERLDAIGDVLVAAGALTENTPEGHPTEDVQDNGLEEDTAGALWIWLYLAHEDKSLGVHNPNYAKAMLTYAEDVLGL